MADHAKFSPSSAHRWMNCHASIAMEDGLPNTTSSYAEEGTRAHTVFAYCLMNNLTSVPLAMCDNEEMCESLQVCLDSIWRRAHGKVLLVEQRVEFSEAIGVPDQFGTSDVIIVDLENCHVEVDDLKYGMGHRVNPENNEQMLTYAVGVCETFESLLGIKFKSFTLGVLQPRLDHEDYWDCDRATIDAHAAKLVYAAVKGLQALIWVRKKKQPPADYYAPGVDTCQWCKAKATCPALTAKVAESVYDDFKALDNPDTIMTQGAPMVPGVDKLGAKYGILALVEDWCRAIRSEVERRVFAGEKVIGPDGQLFKLVEGKKGNRSWTDETIAEGLLTGILPPEKAYAPRKIITASAAAKILDKKKTAAQWVPFKAIITQAPGSPKVALGSDPSPTYSGEAQSSEFDVVTSEVDL